MTAIVPYTPNAIVKWRPQLDTIYHMDALALLRSLDDCSVDLIFIDPPYGLDIDFWDKPISLRPLLCEIERILKPTGFCAFALVMPLLLDWLNTFDKSSLIYKDQICWLKRTHTVNGGLCRTFENLFIYRKEGARYLEVKGRYEDVKVPGILYDAMTIEGIKRHIADLRLKNKLGRQGINTTTSIRHMAHNRYQMGMSDRSPEFCNFTNVWSFLPENQSNRNNAGKHATQKPVLLIERLITLTTPLHATVLDPFMGSGTTAIAARNLDRHYIGCDITKEYVDIANERLQRTDPYRNTVNSNGTVQLSLWETAS